MLVSACQILSFPPQTLLGSLNWFAFLCEKSQLSVPDAEVDVFRYLSFLGESFVWNAKLLSTVSDSIKHFLLLLPLQQTLHTLTCFPVLCNTACKLDKDKRCSWCLLKLDLSLMERCMQQNVCLISKTYLHFLVWCVFKCLFHHKSSAWGSRQYAAVAEVVALLSMCCKNERWCC